MSLPTITQALDDILLQGQQAEAHRPWPRVVVSADTWTLAGRGLAEGRYTLAGLWGEEGFVHMALMADAPFAMAVATLACPDSRFPSIGEMHPPAIRLERTIRDLHGLEPVGLLDKRGWLDHGRWGDARPAPYVFLPAEGESLHQIPVGPVHAGIIEPGHFRFTASGETVVRLEERLGYVHKGTEALMGGADIGRAARLAGRVSGDSTVAYAMAFAQAVESALGIRAPGRALWLRALMAELERLANHLGDIGAICNDASFSLLHAHCGILRERTLRAAEACFGHRLMMDCVMPGGVATDLKPLGEGQVMSLMEEAARLFPRLVELYDSTASLQDRMVTTGLLTPALAARFGAGGYVGRASGRAFDARRAVAYPPYDELEFAVPVMAEGDVNARVWIRIREVEQSLSLIGQILGRLPGGAVRIDCDARSASGVRRGSASWKRFVAMSSPG